MTQEDKILLLKDLCARLPYKLKVKVPTLQEDAIFTLVTICEDYITVMKDNGSCFDIYNSIEVFPFLRSMSSMTREERKEYDSLFKLHEDGNAYCENWEYFDWMNKHHFDYRDLISKGLALEAPEGMYEIQD